MRQVALLIALASVLALVPPAQAADECYTDAATGRFCAAIPAAKPSSPPGLPGVPGQADPYFGKYYLWLGPGECAASPVANQCRGIPAAPGSGVPLPTGGAAGAGVFGLLYEESNGVDGLQRSKFFFGSLRQPDHMVLI